MNRCFEMRPTGDLYEVNCRLEPEPTSGGVYSFRLVKLNERDAHRATAFAMASGLPMEELYEATERAVGREPYTI